MSLINRKSRQSATYTEVTSRFPFHRNITPTRICIYKFPDMRSNHDRPLTQASPLHSLAKARFVDMLPRCSLMLSRYSFVLSLLTLSTEGADRELGRAEKQYLRQREVACCIVVRDSGI